MLRSNLPISLTTNLSVHLAVYSLHLKFRVIAFLFFYMMKSCNSTFHCHPG